MPLNNLLSKMPKPRTRKLLPVYLEEETIKDLLSRFEEISWHRGTSDCVRVILYRAMEDALKAERSNPSRLVH